MHHASRVQQQVQEFLCDQKNSDQDNLPEKLAAFKEKYMEPDLNNEGETDHLMSFKRMEAWGPQDPPGNEDYDLRGVNIDLNLQVLLQVKK